MQRPFSAAPTSESTETQPVDCQTLLVDVPAYLCSHYIVLDSDLTLAELDLPYFYLTFAYIQYTTYFLLFSF